MACENCKHENTVQFLADVKLYLDVGRKVQHVSSMTSVSICRDCGFASWNVTSEELEVLRKAAGE